MWQVRLSSELSEPLKIANEVTQGSTLAPTLFKVLLSTMLRQIIKDLNKGDVVYIRHGLDGSVFDFRRPQAHARPCRIIYDLLIADDTALVVHIDIALQQLTSCLEEVARFLRIEIVLRKTEVPHLPEHRSEYHPPRIIIGATELTVVNQFS